MTQTAAQVLVAEADYLEQERPGEVKHEFIHGVIVAMAGALREHNAIASNIVGVLRALLKEKRCVVFPSDQRVHAEAIGLFTYPDVSVAWEGLRFHPKDRDTLLNPRFLVEVLSISTEASDRGAKFAHYRTLPSLWEYVLVSQHERKVEHYRRLETGQWVLTAYEGDGAAVDLSALGCALPLTDVYDKLELLAAEGSGVGAQGA